MVNKLMPSDQKPTAAAERAPFDPPDRDDDGWYRHTWGPIEDLIADGAWVPDELLARHLRNGWRIPRIVRHLIAARIEGKARRSRGRPQKVLSFEEVCALYAYHGQRRTIHAARRTGRMLPGLGTDLVDTPGTPKELALEAVGERYGINPETLRYWVYSAEDRGQALSKEDRSTAVPNPPVDWDSVCRLIGRRRQRLTSTMRSALATGLRADPAPPDDILDLVSQLLASR